MSTKIESVTLDENDLSILLSRWQETKSFLKEMNFTDSDLECRSFDLAMQSAIIEVTDMFFQKGMDRIELEYEVERQLLVLYGIAPPLFSGYLYMWFIARYESAIFDHELSYNVVKSLLDKGVEPKNLLVIERSERAYKRKRNKNIGSIFNTEPIGRGYNLAYKNGN